MSKGRQLALSIVAGVGLLWIASPAVAQQQEIVVTGKAIPKGHQAVKTNVSIGDIDLSTPSGAKELERRVAQAVDFVCETHLPSGKDELTKNKSCTDFAWASARPQMDRAIEAARAH